MLLFLIEVCVANLPMISRFQAYAFVMGRSINSLTIT
uniref:Uncharacterized protein n=1 Tax=Arundo donax TaxID=35708 RepID=A0A0A9HIJ5_ARUDO